MTSARQGDIHDYDFGPDDGAELSGRRPALIISNHGFNGRFGTAIALPMSSVMPAERYRTRQHVHIADTGSWASTRQVKAVHQRRLGAIMGRATPDELDDIIESLARRFATTHRTGEVATADGIVPIDAGTLWRLPVIGPGRDDRAAGRFSPPFWSSITTPATAWPSRWRSRSENPDPVPRVMCR